MILITFAVPEESGAFCRMLRRRRRCKLGPLSYLDGKLAGRPIRVVHLGMGTACAQNRMRVHLSACRPNLVIAAGFGGALSPDLQVGDVVLDIRTCVFPSLGPLDGVRRGFITSSTNAVETVQEKARIFRETGALAVDMETGAIAGVCAGLEVPVLAVRAISDAASDSLPVPLPAWFDLRRQRSRPLVLLGYLITHPGAVGPFVRFLRGLPRARRSLAHALNSICETLPAGI